ncbi:MAG: ricin-type beta-trefoil lectin domain protein [Acinetobacter sp.]|nr:ricin-type beta-trefoil lectin domain protein [Acinetobacter sp.]
MMPNTPVLHRFLMIGTIALTIATALNANIAHAQSNESSPIFHRNKCVDVSGKDQKSVILHECHGLKNQQFYLQGQQIKNGNQCLDVAQEQTQNGAKVIAYRCTGKSNQQWKIEGYHIRSLLNGKCLHADGTQLSMQECAYGQNKQYFIFPPHIDELY